MIAPTTGTQVAANDIVTRYIAYWEARFAANEGTPNPDDPSLREYATGEQLETVIKETRANLERGLAFRRAKDPSGFQRVSVVEVDGDHAVVQECVVADGVIVRRATGEVVSYEAFGDQSLGRQLRSISRFAHTGEVLGIPGQTIAGLATAGSVVLVWTGLALAWRRWRGWLKRRASVREPISAHSSAA